jgi:hypothetical protein
VKEQHEQLVALLETHSDITGSDHSSVSRDYDNEHFLLMVVRSQELWQA